MLLEKVLVLFSYAAQIPYESSTSGPTVSAIMSLLYNLRFFTSPIILIEITLKQYHVCSVLVQASGIQHYAFLEHFEFLS